jgi:hypothetical protein
MQSAESPRTISHQNYTHQPFMSTPKTNKVTDSKSPHRLVQKKSKRRDCTPEYSPPDSETKGTIKERFFTERKEFLKRTNLFSKEENINKNLFNKEYETLGSRQPFGLQSSEPQPRAEPKKKFLSLIEECTNENNSEGYYGQLGSRTTPDSLLSTIFSEINDLSLSKVKLENPERRPVNNNLNSFLVENLAIFFNNLTNSLEDLRKMVINF